MKNICPRCEIELVKVHKDPTILCCTNCSDRFVIPKYIEGDREKVNSEIKIQYIIYEVFSGDSYTGGKQ